MKIKEYLLPKPITIEEFAKKHNLTMEVHQRKDKDYYAHFEDASIRHNSYFLLYTYGNGNTPKQAIVDYSRKISNQILIDKNKNEIIVGKLK